MESRTLGYFSATSIVVASMIGSGIFTATGLIVSILSTPFLLLFVWLTGGIVSLCGALSYAELAVAIPKSGGEYHYLSKIYHPSVGFLSAWISLIVGFSAPIAAVSFAFGKYLYASMPLVPAEYSALIIIVLFSFLHLTDVRLGSYVQNFLTFLKVSLILILVVIGFFFGSGGLPSLSPTESDMRTIFSSPFALALILVSFAYSGWNAAVYIGGEIKKPEKILPAALIQGTILVIVLYLFVNLLYIYALPIEKMAGKIDIAHEVFLNLFGSDSARLLSLIISFVLVSSVSAMIMAGPRVYQAMGEDIHFFKILSVKTKKGTPINSIILQMAISILLLFTMTFESLLYYIGIATSIFAWLTVFGVYLFRFKKKTMHTAYRTWGYPIVPALFLIPGAWAILYSLIEKTIESLCVLGTLILGLFIFFLTKERKKKIPFH